MHLQQQSKSDKTVQAKSAFEKYICSQGIQIKHYHADNGRFADNALLKSFNKEVQTLSLCVVNSHLEKWCSRENNQWSTVLGQNHGAPLQGTLSTSHISRPLELYLAAGE